MIHSAHVYRGLAVVSSVADGFFNDSMAFLRLPDGRWSVGWGHAAWKSELAPGERAFFAPDFFLKTKTPWLTFENYRVYGDSNWMDELPLAQPTPQAVFLPPSKKNFLNRAKQLLLEIEAGSLKKAIPVEFEIASSTSFDWTSSVKALRQAPAYAYGFHEGGEAMIGATPEILVEKTGRHVKTMALAGTGSLEGPNLLENPKEMLEHRLVICDIEERLSMFGKVSRGETVEKTLPRLKHLLTPMEVETRDDISIEKLVRSLHPTAALGGFPSEAARAWLAVQPEAPFRARFGAPFGFAECCSAARGGSDGTDAFIVVAIRNIQVHSSRVWLGSGCGIVEGSQPEKEWDELTLKRDSVKEQLGLS